MLPNGVILELNEAVINILGSPSKEITKSLNVLTTKSLVDSGFSNYFIQCVEQKKIIKGEINYKSIWGKNSYLRFYLSPILMDNTVQSIFINIEDISEMHQSRLNLVKLKEKAEESDRLKSAFLANMSHEIRTPMNGIIGFAELLKEPDITEEKKKYFVDIINTNAYLLLDLINDIIDISQIESGLININPSEVNINKLLEEIMDMWLPMAERKNIQLIFDCTPFTSHIGTITDLVKLKQIIINLISNAIKFTTQGKVEFGYSVENNNIVFFVKDTGAGIPSENINRIFERFSQLNNLPQDSRTGTGLGLAICNAYVKLLGGEIWFSSELKKGSTFYFSIPYKPTTIISDTTMEKHDNYDWSQKTILLAEDDVPNSLYIVESLRKTKANIIAVKTGQDAIEEIKLGKQIDLVLMDIKMPIVDGLTATKEILKIKPDIPIIAQTAYAFVEDREKAKNAGCVDFISKPMKSVELISTIAKYLIKESNS